MVPFRVSEVLCRDWIRTGRSGIGVAIRLAGGGVRTVQHLAERGVRLVFEVFVHLGARGCSAHLKQPLERPKYTVLSGHVFIWSLYLRIDLRYLESLFADRSQVVCI